MAAADPALLAPLRSSPERAAVLLDFDGTLAPIVERADAATALPGVRAALTALAEVYAVVAIVSGRPAAYLVPQVPEGVVINGLYGLEWARDGEIRRPPEAERWAAVVDEVAAAAAAVGTDALEVEHKGLSLTLHYRTHPDDAGEVLVWATDQAERTGLVVREAKMSLELHPPLSYDKGSAVEELVAGLDAACFLGADVGDLPAFAALDRLAERGVATSKEEASWGKTP